MDARGLFVIVAALIVIFAATFLPCADAARPVSPSPASTLMEMLVVSEGLLARVVAAGCWRLVRLFFSRPGGRSMAPAAFLLWQRSAFLGSFIPLYFGFD
jgi:hypothetical protein